MAALAPGVGIILGGALTTLFSPRAAYLAAGLGLVALIAVAAFIRARAARVPHLGGISPIGLLDGQAAR
jgi:hypothetical protein